jgi:2-C-methyl-D-erythritol 2,4-cyclodiphosphate synthase
MKIRVGQGFDMHAFAAGRRLVLGGVEIEHSVGGQRLGLLGHSDADVLLHALTDALLGAAGLGDIGRLFPDTDAQYRDADSRVLLRRAVQRLRDAGWRIENVDCTVICEQPKIAPHADAMRAGIASDLEIEMEAVSVKGKTTETLGCTGRGEGIAAMAVVLLSTI